jgi:hypothetical protein
MIRGTRHDNPDVIDKVLRAFASEKHSIEKPISELIVFDELSRIMEARGFHPGSSDAFYDKWIVKYSCSNIRGFFYGAQVLGFENAVGVTTSLFDHDYLPFRNFTSPTLRIASPEQWHHSNRSVFATDGPDGFFVDWKPGPNGRFGQVVRYAGYLSAQRVIASSLYDFFNFYLQNPALTFEELFGEDPLDYVER